MLNITKEFLIEEYINKKLTIKSIANNINCSPSYIGKQIKKYKIKIRTNSESHIKKNIIGKRFNQLTVIKFEYIKNQRGHWKCICSCGQEKIIDYTSLTKNKIKSCGCILYKGGIYLTGSEFASIRCGAKIRNLEFSITIQDIEEIYKKQNFKCALSNRNLKFNSRNIKTKQINGDASVDRIDSSKGYTKDNIQILHKDVNMAKQTLSQIDFIKLCKEVTNFTKGNNDK